MRSHRFKAEFVTESSHEHEVVGQKSSSFILFEDKYQFLGVDFAWHLDKNTKKLRPVLLSEGTIKLKKMPEEFYCNVF